MLFDYCMKIGYAKEVWQNQNLFNIAFHLFGIKPSLDQVSVICANYSSNI